jgi:type II restriction enzyme
MKQQLVDFSDPILSAVLFILLKDRTTGKNIIWATDPPPELGADFTDEITLEQIKKCPPVPRVLKRLDEQKQRTKAKAEVFTPSWVCEKMIDMGEENGAMPDMKKEPIKYIHSTVLEITCGEAPFLVNRYDTVTGKKIPVPKRKGLFDRKLKCVNNWFDWNVWTWHDVAEDAATTTYGYEWQGDSLLLARANMLLTWRENFKWLFGIEPDAGKVRNMAAIISWNVWQMDGLKKTVPGTDIPCKIKDWKADKEILLKDVGEDK